jgi:heme exporter protein D
MGGRFTAKESYIMNWSSVSEFFLMGGYGLYVWGSYVVALICIVGEVLLISNRRRTLEKQHSLIHDTNRKRDENEITS